MPKVQNDFYFRWAQARVQATYSANQTLTSLIEFVGVDTVLNVVQIELPDSSDADVLNTKRICIIDKGNAGANNITVIPNGLDGTTIEGYASFLIDKDFTVIMFELIDGQWIVVANTRPVLNLGSFHMHDNMTITTIATVMTNTDIAGTAIGSMLNNNFTFATAPNSLKYTGIKDIIGQLHISTSMSKANSSDKVFRISGIKNGAEIAGCSIATNILKPMQEVSVVYPVLISTDDVFKVMIRNESDAEDVDVTDLVVTINEE